MGAYDDMSLPWNGLQGGNTRQGVAISSETVQQADYILNPAKVYPWPNPANQMVHIRYKMGQSGKITARIFDGSGDLVKEISKMAESGLEGDLVWDLTGVTSGVYIGRIEAEAGGQKEKTFIKIAVVK
jgi:hypothetical protein